MLEFLHESKYQEIKNNIYEQSPKSNLAEQSFLMLKYLSIWKKILILFFGVCMLIFPYLINLMNIKMIKNMGDIRFSFCIVNITQTLIDVIRTIFMIFIGTKNAIQFLNTEVFRYSMLSKQTTYKYSATKTMDQDIRDASNTINRFIEWGLTAFVSAIGSMLSCFLILLSMNPSMYDLIALLFLFFLFFGLLHPIQKRLTVNMEKQQKIYHRTRDLLTFRSIEFQNKECSPKEYFRTIVAPFEYGIQVECLFNLAYYAINLITNVFIFLFAYSVKDDRSFAEKYVVISSITLAIREISEFGNHYRRYCNEYGKYVSMFSDNLSYDETISQEDIPQMFCIESIDISKGAHHIHCNDKIEIEQGKHYLIRGPSGSGKSTLLDAFLGYLPKIVLDNGVNIRAYNEKIVVHLQHCSATKLTNVSIYDVFRSRERDKIREMVEMFIPRNKFEIILQNIGNNSKEDAFGLYIEDKMSGGEKTRFFLAKTLFKALKIGAKIVFLDEPEDGQDPDKQIESFRVIYELARKHNLTVFWITHLRDNVLEETNINFDGGILQFDIDGQLKRLRNH